MQDFTKNTVPATNRQPASARKQNPFWSTDRTWNLIFALIWSLGFVIVGGITLLLGFELNAHAPLIPLFLSFFMILKYNKTSFDKANKKFLNNEHKPIDDKQLPIAFFIVLCTFAPTVLTGLFLDKYSPEDVFLGAAVIWSVIGFSFALYFIYLNCPITILFSKSIWNGDYQSPKCSGSKLNTSHNSKRWYNNPSYSSSPGNIYYKRK